MKHIARTFLNQYNEKEFEKLGAGYEKLVFKRGEGNTLSKTEIPKAEFSFLRTENDTYIKFFPHKVKGQLYTFPEPDPTYIYFSSAQKFRREIDYFKDLLLPKINPDSSVREEFTHDFYHYYGSVSGTVIFLFSSIECFMNGLLKPEDMYIRKLSMKTEQYNFAQIQENINFGEKIKEVIPQLRNMDFMKKHPLKAELINNLKEFRDNIIHTKTKSESVKHDFLIKRSFSFKFDEAIDAVADYMNYHKPDYIKECGCGRDF